MLKELDSKEAALIDEHASRIGKYISNHRSIGKLDAKMTEVKEQRRSLMSLLGKTEDPGQVSRINSKIARNDAAYRTLYTNIRAMLNEQVSLASYVRRLFEASDGIRAFHVRKHDADYTVCMISSHVYILESCQNEYGRLPFREVLEAERAELEENIRLLEKDADDAIEAFADGLKAMGLEGGIEIDELASGFVMPAEASTDVAILDGEVG